jgi:hypothetical protein
MTSDLIAVLRVLVDGDTATASVLLGEHPKPHLLAALACQHLADAIVLLSEEWGSTPDQVLASMELRAAGAG